MHDNKASEKVISRALGKALREAREALHWSRGQLVARLPSRIGDRTLLTYEHGTRPLTVLRLLEIARVVGIPGPTLLTLALQKAELELTNLVLRVDLHALLKNESVECRPMIQWARNKLNKNPDGFVELSPSIVEELANFAGYAHEDLAKYLAQFAPKEDDPEASDTADTDSEAHT
jgi:transcriptional regulator with XRE-family HTH domain